VGRNLLIGGSGLDTLQGGPGEEILIGGATKYDHRGAALAAVMRQWRSADAFDARCGRLASGFRDSTAGFIQLKRNTRSFAQGTVLNDGARDLLYGSSGYDWFFQFAKDQTDRGFDDR
jgi:Ca2+-binding RTX toxin-like protein